MSHRLYSFSTALDAMQCGEHITRDGWNGKGMYLFILKGLTAMKPQLARFHAGVMQDAHEAYGADRIGIEPFVVMKTADNKYIPWLASQSDLLANDWIIL